MTHSTQTEGHMNESMRESLSALMDGEASEIELHRILASTDDDELRAAWSGMHRNSDILRGTAVITRMDISRAVSESVAKIDFAPVADKVAGGGMRRSLVSFAVAASVTAVVVFGGQQFLTSPDSITPAGVGSPGLVNSGGAVPVRASFGSRTEQPSMVLQPATGAGYQELARQRLRKYSQAHAEQAALNTPQGLVPFARVQDIQSQ
ncbi:RseA-like anti sigma(E) protein [Chromatocurvus halotolerans]|uniref:RseA-like anti sigma(E) protein n=2 Tax=Chromatocurvus halotolerans TaxID=1132028 RepID=A0A4R2KV73_9GAMM|nr:RseA-like anti sigma(E) protein [Chromatocurvus halotolerans]